MLLECFKEFCGADGWLELGVRPFARRHKDLVVLHFDAHWDLRDGYLGEPYSHAAAMRRVMDQPGHENITLVSVGIRAL